MRAAGHQYERLIEDLSKSEADLFLTKQRYTALALAYKEATGHEPPAFQTSTEEEDIVDTRPRNHKTGAHRNGLEEAPSIMNVAGAPVWSYFDPTKFTSSQEDLQTRLSPPRQSRSVHSERPGRGGKLMFVEDPVLKPTIVPTPPLLSLDSAAIMTPPARNERSAKTKPSGTTQTSYHSKSGPLSSKTHVPSEYPAAHASTSSSQQSQPISPPERLRRHPTTRGTKSSNTNHAAHHESAIVRKHVNNANARRKLTAAVDHAEAISYARSQKSKEELRARKSEHRQFVEERSKALQVEMGVDLGDFPPPGVPPLKSRWTTFKVGEPRYAPRYVTPNPAVKQEEEEVQLSTEDPNAPAPRRPARARVPDRKESGRDEEDEESDEDEDAYYQEFIPSRSGSYEAVDDNGYVQQQFDEYDYAPVPIKSTAGATEGSNGSLKSKYGDRHGRPEEDVVDAEHETRPTKRRRLATQDPPSSHTRTVQNPPPRRSSARLVERRINNNPQPQSQQQPQQTQRRQTSQPRHAAPSASRRTPQARAAARIVRGAAVVSKSDRRAETQRMREISEEESNAEVQPTRNTLGAEVPEAEDAISEERLDDDPIAGDPLPPVSKLLD